MTAVAACTAAGGDVILGEAAATGDVAFDDSSANDVAVDDVTAGDLATVDFIVDDVAVDDAVACDDTNAPRAGEVSDVSCDLEA